MQTKFLFYLLILFPVIGQSQNSECACCTPEHAQFDFWIGDWEVFNEKGEKIGENLVKKLEDNCILNENWEGAKGGSGKSYNYYDPADSTWNQLWISNSGNILKLKGTGSKDKMILKSSLNRGEKGEYYNQISWIKNENGSITQLWEIYDAKGNLLNEAFKGIYKKKTVK